MLSNYLHPFLFYRLTPFPSTGNGVQSIATFDPVKGDLKHLNAATLGGALVLDEQYEYDALHQITERRDQVGANSHLETFHYDELGRLETITGPSAKTFTYEASGNMKTQSGLGTYYYLAQTPGNVRSIPHAVSHVKVGTATVAAFTYDAIGQALTATRTEGGVTKTQTFTYTPSGQLDTVTSPQTGTMAFTYGPGGEKLVETETTNIRARSVTYSAGRERIKIYAPNANPLTATPTETQDKYYLSAGGATVAVFTKTQTGTAPVVKSLVYMHHDRLGSVAAVTDTLGAVIERFSYEAFGKKRNAETWGALTPGQSVAIHTSEGFTGHEQLEAFGLIHMGGRIYDPVLCRFTSADPVVQAPTNGQSYNRYSYIMNSPINGTDPSGYSWFSDIWDAKVEFFSDAHDSLVETFSDLHDDTNQFIKKNYKVILTIAVIVVIAFVAPIITSALTGVATTAFTTTELVIAGAIGGALSGAATTAIAGGSTSDILKAAAFGAVSGALTAGIGHGIGAFADGAGKYLAKPIVHGLVQGGISEAQGGDFKSAAIGAAAGSFLGGAMEWAGVGVGDKSIGQRCPSS